MSSYYVAKYNKKIIFLRKLEKIKKVYQLFIFAHEINIHFN